MEISCSLVRSFSNLFKSIRPAHQALTNFHWHVRGSWSNFRVMEVCLLTNKTSYLGPVICAVQFEVAGHPTNATCNFKLSATQTEVCLFIGFGNLFCCFPKTLLSFHTAETKTARIAGQLIMSAEWCRVMRIKNNGKRALNIANFGFTKNWSEPYALHKVKSSEDQVHVTAIEKQKCCRFS